MIANELDNTLVLLGDATDEELLEQENIAEMDLFLAVTNDDEDNIMSGSLAKRLGSKRVVALINRRAYAEMIEGGPIDIGISPAQVSIGALLAHVRQGDVAEVHSSAARRRRSAWNWSPMAMPRRRRSSASVSTRSTGRMASRSPRWCAISTRP